jgi:hypothetical protein
MTEGSISVASMETIHSAEDSMGRTISLEDKTSDSMVCTLYQRKDFHQIYMDPVMSARPSVQREKSRNKLL